MTAGLHGKTVWQAASLL